jgi:type I restriction enzyme R subunit
MQALARVNRRFRDKKDGLLVGYAPLTENLRKALTEYSTADQDDQTLGREIDRAISEVHNEVSVIADMLAPMKWQAILADERDPNRWMRAVRKAANFLRDPRTPGNVVEGDVKPLHKRFRESSGRLERFYTLCATSRDFAERAGDVATLRRNIQFFTGVRIMMVKLDAADREARGLPRTAEVERYLAQLAAEAVDAADITDIYKEAGLGRLDITELNEAAIHRLENHETPQLAVEALRRLIQQKMREVTKHNVVRQESFSARLEELMSRYMRQQLTSAQLIAELVAMAKEVSADARRGQQFDPPLNHAELAFYDAVAQHGIAAAVMGTDTLAEIARELVKSIQSSITVDWFSRERYARSCAVTSAGCWPARDVVVTSAGRSRATVSREKRSARVCGQDPARYRTPPASLAHSPAAMLSALPGWPVRSVGGRRTATTDRRSRRRSPSHPRWSPGRYGRRSST